MLIILDSVFLSKSRHAQYIITQQFHCKSASFIDDIILFMTIMAQA